MKIISLNMRGWGSIDKRRRIRKMLKSGKFDFCLLQETKFRGLSRSRVASIWGRGGIDFDWVSRDAVGQSGGLLCVWNQGLFDFQFSFQGDHFVGVCVKHQGYLCYIVNVYSACIMEGKRQLWNELRKLKRDFEVGDWCVAGDFNAIVSR